MSENNHISSCKLIAASVLVTSGMYLTNGLEHLETLVGLKEEAVSTVYYETKAYLAYVCKRKWKWKDLSYDSEW